MAIEGLCVVVIVPGVRDEQAPRFSAHIRCYHTIRIPGYDSQFDGFVPWLGDSLGRSVGLSLDRQRTLKPIRLVSRRVYLHDAC